MASHHHQHRRKTKVGFCSDVLIATIFNCVFCICFDGFSQSIYYFNRLFQHRHGSVHNGQSNSRLFKAAIFFYCPTKTFGTPCEKIIKPPLVEIEQLHNIQCPKKVLPQANFDRKVRFFLLKNYEKNMKNSSKWVLSEIIQRSLNYRNFHCLNRFRKRYHFPTFRKPFLNFCSILLKFSIKF